MEQWNARIPYTQNYKRDYRYRPEKVLRAQWQRTNVERDEVEKSRFCNTVTTLKLEVGLALWVVILL